MKDNYMYGNIEFDGIWVLEDEDMADDTDTEYLRADTVEVDVGELKKPPTGLFGATPQEQGWNACIDHLLSQGIIREKK